MAIEQLQDKIRKLKNPCIVDFSAEKDHIPPYILAEERDFVHGYGRFCTELLEGLSGKVAGIRFSFGSFAVMGTQGLALLSRLLDTAKQLGFYVLLDMPDALSAMAARHYANALSEPGNPWTCDGILISAYIGTDAMKAYMPLLKSGDKDLFVVLRTSNKSAPELQELLSGGRLTYMALADQLNRLGADSVGKGGYSHLCAVGAASSADCLRTLRGKYKTMFLLLDGSDYPNANAKNCSFAFDQLGRGAAACVGLSVTAAWKTEGTLGEDYVESACQSVERIKRNFARYITIL